MLTIPFPPSVNSLWRSVNGRSISSKRYREWQHEASLALMTQRPAKHEGPVRVHLVAGLPDKRRRDPDNIFKGVMDLLVRHQVIQDDHFGFVHDLRVSKGEGFVGVRISIEPVA